MCMEDVRLGRASYREQKTIVVTDASAVLLSPSDSRVGVVIDNGGTENVTLSLNNPAVIEEGIVLEPSDPPMTLAVQYHGQIVTGGLYAVCAATKTSKIQIWATYLDAK